MNIKKKYVTTNSSYNSTYKSVYVDHIFAFGGKKCVYTGACCILRISLVT